MTRIRVPKIPHAQGTCGKRPSLRQNVWNAMAPPCKKTPKHKGPHDWQIDRWRIS